MPLVPIEFSREVLVEQVAGHVGQEFDLRLQEFMSKEHTNPTAWIRARWIVEEATRKAIGELLK